MNKELLKDIENRTDIIINDNSDYKDIFKNLKSELISAYMRNDFRLSVLKDFSSKLLAIIHLANDEFK